MNKRTVLYWVLFALTMIVFIAGIAISIVAIVREKANLVIASSSLTALGVGINTINVFVVNPNRTTKQVGDKSDSKK